MHDDACCAQGLDNLLNKALSPKTEDDPRQGPVLRAAMTFISAKRTNEEFTALLDKLITCQCQPAVRASHGPVFRPLSEFLELVLSVIGGTTSDLLMRLGAGKLRKQRPNLPPDAQPWPSRVSDVIPTPTEQDLLSAFVQWAIIVPGGHGVFPLIGALARYWDPFSLELFCTPALFRIATHHLRCALDAYDPAAPPAEQAKRFISPVIGCAQGLFYILFEINREMTLGILPPIYEEMYAIADRIIPILVRVKEDTSPLFPMDSSCAWFGTILSLRRFFNTDGTFNLTERAPEDAGFSKDNGRMDFGNAFLRMVEIRNRNQVR